MNSDTKECGIQSRFKMADKSLRQAMGYALDNNAVGERFYAGLRSNATSFDPTSIPVISR